jgi:hypothetical protein
VLGLTVLHPLEHFSTLPAAKRFNCGSSGLNRFAQTGPTMIYALLQQLQALGLNVPEILKQLGTTAESTNGSEGVGSSIETEATSKKASKPS